MKSRLDGQALLGEFVRRPSLSGREDALAQWLERELAACPWQLERVGNSLLITIGTGEGPTLLCHSHLDTVAAGEGWSCDPHGGHWNDGRLVGLGANDAGAAAVAMLCALEQVAQLSLGQPLAGTVHLALCAEEETNNSGMAEVLARLAERGSQPDGAICGEPTGLEVVRAQAGLAVLVAEWKGKSCHAARALSVEHDNALLAAAREVAGLPPVLVLEGEHTLLGPSTIVPAAFTSGAAHNRVPDRARLLLDARLAPPHDALECVQVLRTWLPAAHITIKSDRLVAVETAEDHPLVLAALEAVAAVSAPGASDANRFPGAPGVNSANSAPGANRAMRDTGAGNGASAVGSATMSDMALIPDIPAIKCGPGISERSHAPDEYITAAELQAGTAFYTRAIPACLHSLTPEVAIP